MWKIMRDGIKAYDCLELTQWFQNSTLKNKRELFKAFLREGGNSNGGVFNFVEYAIGNVGDKLTYDNTDSSTGAGSSAAGSGLDEASRFTSSDAPCARPAAAAMGSSLAPTTTGDCGITADGSLELVVADAATYCAMSDSHITGTGRGATGSAPASSASAPAGDSHFTGADSGATDSDPAPSGLVVTGSAPRVTIEVRSSSSCALVTITVSST
jgi:hypothetical protein